MSGQPFHILQWAWKCAQELWNQNLNWCSGLGGLIPTKVNFSTPFHVQKTRDLSPSLGLIIILYQISHLNMVTQQDWNQQHQVPHQGWLCPHCLGNGTYINNSKLNLKSPLFSLPHCSRSEFASTHHLFCSKAGWRNFQLLASCSHISLKVSQNRDLGGFQ